jgi:Cu/Ag efflux protein CusF
MQRILPLLADPTLAASLRPVALAAGESRTSAPAAPAHDSHHKADALATGEVKSVDKGAGKITIKHGPLANLDMPSMTMVFRVKEPAMLDHVKAGDKVKFQAEKIGGAFTVTRIEQAN